MPWKTAALKEWQIKLSPIVTHIVAISQVIGGTLEYSFGRISKLEQSATLCRFRLDHNSLVTGSFQILRYQGFITGQRDVMVARVLRILTEIEHQPFLDL